jgi:DNA-binding transcriptional MerR regulator
MAYTLLDLASITNTSPHKLQRWVKAGVLPRVGSGNAGAYTDDHIRRIRDIKDAFDNNVTLADLRDRFNPPDDDDESAE